jgi:hypothetical protein
VKAKKADPFERFKDLEAEHCWQYEVRLRNMQEDLQEIGKDLAWAESLRTTDFDFVAVVEPPPFSLPFCYNEKWYKKKLNEYRATVKKYKEQCDEVRDFIIRHEFLGCLPNRPTHRFTARMKKTGELAGVVVMAVPNTFSHLIGKDNKNMVKLVSRGASISWAPKNLGSWIVSRSCKWMVQNTKFRAFEAYSDPLAKELGTIYQALNWTYLGQTSGTAKVYRDPKDKERGWFSDRDFRKKSKYKRYAESLGIGANEWKKYMGKYTPKWEEMEVTTPGLKDKLKAKEKEYRESCEWRVVPPKHKYCFILGRTKKETKQLHKLFKDNNPKKVGLPYPKERGE